MKYLFYSPFIRYINFLSKRWASFTIAVLLITNLNVVTVGAEENKYDEQFYNGNGILYYDPRVGTCSTESADTSMNVIVTGSEFSLGEDKSMRPVILLRQLMTDFNFTDFQAAGIVGNFMHESGGQHVPPDVNEGGSVGPPAFSGGYGWAQWTGGRQTAFIDYAIKNGYMESKDVNANDSANYAWLVYEITKTSESKAVGALKATKTVIEASQTWEKVFERAGVVANEKRDKHASDVLKAHLSNSGVSGIGGNTEQSSTSGESPDCPVPTGGTSSGNSSTFGPIAFPLKGTQKTVTNASSIFKNNTTIGGHDYPNAYDIYAPAGTEVVALASGTVTRISEDKCGSRLVGIWNKNANTVVTYMHMVSSPHAKEGKDVKPGDFVGIVASVKDYSCVNVDHLHIDAMKDMKIRGPCQRGACYEPYRSKIIDIGPDLYSTYKALPE